MENLRRLQQFNTLISYSMMNFTPNIVKIWLNILSREFLTMEMRSNGGVKHVNQRNRI